jgi:hypothetical protein
MSSNIQKIYIPIEDRPRCNVPGCNRPVQFVGTYRKDGTPQFRKMCGTHHNEKIAKKRGLKNMEEVLAQNAGISVKQYRNQIEKNAAKNAGFDDVREWRKFILENAAKNAGFDDVIKYQNSKHPYRKYRKSYCENIDGRLGYTCTTTIMWDGQLEVDHIDGNPRNNDEENLQTLCSCCHKYKSYINEDYRSPGRKALGVTY